MDDQAPRARLAAQRARDGVEIEVGGEILSASAQVHPWELARSRARRVQFGHTVAVVRLKA